MQYSPHLPCAHISLENIADNFALINEITQAARLKLGKEPVPTRIHLPVEGDMDFKWPTQMAVIKADAYGHGHIEVARRLLERGARMFASGSVQEAVALRQGLGQKTPYPVILSLLGLVGENDVELCAAHGIIPIVHSFDQLPMLERLTRPLSVALKCNTGMSRLGFNEDELPRLLQALAPQTIVRPVIALSHMASADTDRGPEEIARQGRIFAHMLEALRSVWPGLAASLGNSAGTLLAEHINAAIGPHVCRPGLSLYGSNPFEGTSLAGLGAGLKGAMDVSAPIIALRELKPGDGLGYGHTFVAEKSTFIGIVGTGYADCYSRGLGNTGVMCVDGWRAPVLGRVSMQMTAIGLGDLPANGTRPTLAWLLGGPHANAVSANKLARLWGTITYEVFCLLGYNTRIFID
ncbi:alanine racemase [Desulfovibrio sp. OttesenSCG-928-M14]|nr:alanine racemase [Desulfovibrio sp. OttesenSCG-928-M14]